VNQVSSTLRKVSGGYAHWCPGCEGMHILPDSWHFNGNLDKPTFAPSFKHQGIQRVFSDGKWTGEWVKDSGGNPVPFQCHYVLTDGILKFCSDSTHSLSSKSVPLPVLPEGFCDEY